MVDNTLNTLLVVEDNPGLQKQLKWSFDGYDVHIAGDRTEAISIAKKYKPQVITLDLGLPPDKENASEGLAALEEILHLLPESKIIVVTGNEDRENALKAVDLGAYDFYQKPIDPDVLGLIVDRAFNLRLLELENSNLKSNREHESALGKIIASSDAMLSVCRMTEKVATSDVTTLVHGESGTGKELIARALHDLSDRKDHAFVAINCAAIPGDLLESELFGYEKGAFTGAHKQILGKIELANGGTLFLDEIGDMPTSLQAKLLRFLQERVIERLGGRKQIPVDVRVVCATHRNLEQAIAAGDFREDLYFRVSEVIIEIPALRDREDDRLTLAQHFLRKFCKAQKKKIKGFADDAKQRINTHAWPGNVRELENKIKRAVILSDGQKITSEDLGFSESESEQDNSLSLKLAREAVERKLVKRALTVYDNNLSRAAEALEISRPSLYSLMKKLGMSGDS